jgi:SAM-dependent methyltransferase
MSPSDSDIPPLRCHACGATMPDARAFRAVDRLHGTPGEFAVAICPACGSGVTTPLVSGAELGDYYPSSYGPYDDPANPAVRLISRAIRRRQSRRALATFPVAALRAAGPGRGIDIGCGRGDLAAALIGAGWSMAGIEPSPEAAANARARGVDVRVGTLANCAPEPGAHDAAVFQHSLEHTVEPLADLERIRDALRPGGLVAITVPNFGNWQARRLRSRWYHLDVPRHRTHFTGDGLVTVLERAGLKVEDVRTSTSAAGLPASIQYRVAGRCLFPDGLRLRMASGLCILTLPAARLGNRIGGGGDQLHVVARRRA